MSSSKTIRLQNTGLTNLSLHLYQLRPAAHGAMKKGPTLTPILIAAGRYYDVCSELGCSFEDAQKICDRSPEVRAFESSGRLARIIFPPPMPVGQAAEVFALPPQVVISGVEVTPPAPAPAPEPSPAPALEAEHTFLARAAAAPELEPAPAPELEPLPLPPEPEPARTVRRGEPSMDWAEDELRFYAETHGIDLSKAKSKTSILRTIRSAK